MTRRFLAAACALAAAWSPCATAGNGVAEPAMATAATELQLGQGKLLRLPRPASSVFVADAGVADVVVRSPTLIYITPQSIGRTSLTAVDVAGRTMFDTLVQVTPDRGAMAAALRSVLPGRDIGITVAGGNVVLTGTLDDPDEVELAVDVASRLLGPRGRSQVLNRLAVSSPVQVNLRVKIVEVSRETVRQLGFNWDAFAGVGDVAFGLAAGNITRSAAGAFGYNSRVEGVDNLLASFRNGSVDINGVIDALDRRGLVSVLAEPNLTAVSGASASFLAGGEFPVPVPQGNLTTTIEYKRFGVSLTFTATVMSGDRIHLAVNPEVSQLSDAGSVRVEGFRIPALTTRRVSTSVELGSGQSFAIAGLLQNSNSRDLRKLPGLGDIPVLGELFRSRRFSNSETELVVIVTPYLVRPVRPSDIVLPRSAP